MKYALLIYGPETGVEPTPEQLAQVMDAYNAFTKAVNDQVTTYLETGHHDTTCTSAPA